jgi:hypothetical protein
VFRRKTKRLKLAAGLVGLALWTISAVSAAPSPVLEKQFDEVVKPFISQHCLGCHSGEKPASQFNMAVYSTIQAVKDDHRTTHAGR